MHDMEHINPGDAVIIDGRFEDTLVTVERVTKTQIITKGGGRYRRADGFAVGRNQFGVIYIREATDKDRARITYRDAARRAESVLSIRRVEGADRHKVETYETRLREAKAIIDAALGTGEAQ